MTPSLLLICAKDTPAIVTVPLANFSLQFIVESFSTRAKHVSVYSNSFKLIVALASEGALYVPCIFDDAFKSLATNESILEGA
jgi:hypothetical protein